MSSFRILLGRPILARVPHFRKLIHPALLRRSFAATPCIRNTRPDPKSNKQTNVGTRPTLRENIYTIPNLLTVSRIFACPVLGWSILNNDFYLATGLLVYAGLSDIVSSTLNTNPRTSQRSII